MRPQARIGPGLAFWFKIGDTVEEGVVYFAEQVWLFCCRWGSSKAWIVDMNLHRLNQYKKWATAMGKGSFLTLRKFLRNSPIQGLLTRREDTVCSVVLETCCRHGPQFKFCRVPVLSWKFVLPLCLCLVFLSFSLPYTCFICSLALVCLSLCFSFTLCWFICFHAESPASVPKSLRVPCVPRMFPMALWVSPLFLEHCFLDSAFFCCLPRCYLHFGLFEFWTWAVVMKTCFLLFNLPPPCLWVWVLFEKLWQLMS